MKIFKTFATLAVAAGILASNVGVVAAHNGKDGVSLQAALRAEAEGSVKSDDKDDKQDKKVEMAVDGPCMAAAVDARDNAVIAALDTYHANIKVALTARRDALKAAWLMTDPAARKAALRKAWDDFKGTWKKNAKELKAARKAAWKTFETSRKACKGQNEDEQGRGVDFKL